MNKKAQRINAVQAFLVSLLLILNGINVFDNYPWIGALNTIFGCMVLVFAINFFRGKSKPLYKSISLFIEGLGLLLAAYILYDKGSNYLHFAVIIAAFLCFIGSSVMYRKMRRGRDDSAPLNNL